ncbi:fumarylacetoacetate hydrolase family protein [Actinomadura sp. NAK00032]|uniref:fumarylacetoacetate hydrolase family protein n=1 Tax=Actinomadura sp. NAK00032 TaxID=2742128 RepID=UPI0015902529|nr:fumarylacetoacetate hydrolase family protein [Actinomadura sp. NAK00032]QKW33430.1 fumarylacetoacetate hydrolase family protein [Actinomadura sp. NAK00032]
MRLANHAGRAVLVVSDGKTADIETASAGRFGPDPQSLYDRWDEFTAWAATATPAPDVEIDRLHLGSPAPTPSQVVAIGLNYADHAAETGFEPPTDLPPVFTKFASSITGPYGEIGLPDGGHTDWEVEVVAVIGRPAHRVSADRAWDHVAGLTVGQDLSERILQFTGEAPQFGFAKSYPGFAPIGPWLVTLDEIPDRDDLALGCSIDGETVQDGRTSKLIFSIPRTIAKLSEVLTLHPGDVIFTGTPDGVGLGRTPQRFLRSGETLRTWVEGIGEMEHTFR